MKYLFGSEPELWKACDELLRAQPGVEVWEGDVTSCRALAQVWKCWGSMCPDASHTSRCGCVKVCNELCQVLDGRQRAHSKLAFSFASARSWRGSRKKLEGGSVRRWRGKAGRGEGHVIREERVVGEEWVGE
eukprot:350891-Chlamydomonas_euryale.AAC.14